MITPLFNPVLFRPQSTNNNYSNFQKKTVNFKGNLNSDVFESSTNKNFNIKDYYSIKKSIKKNNFIGSGSEGKVFRMEDENFVVKIPNTFFTKTKIDDNTLRKKLIEEPVTDKDKINFITKKYKNGVKIMEYIKGESIRDIHKTDKMNEVVNLPVEAYQKLLNQNIDAHNNDMMFDFAMNNVIYNDKEKTLTAIDFIPYEKVKNTKKEFSPLKYMYFALDCFKKPYEKEVSAKLLSATITNMKSNSKCNLPPNNYDYKEITRILEYNYPLDYLKIKDTEDKINNITLIKNFCKSEYGNKELDFFIDNTNDFINKSFIQ